VAGILILLVPRRLLLMPLSVVVAFEAMFKDWKRAANLESTYNKGQRLIKFISFINCYCLYPVLWSQVWQIVDYTNI